MKRAYSITEHVLLGLVPYTQSNLKLTFKPSAFFAELEHVSKANRQTLQSTLARVIRQGYVSRHNGRPSLTPSGLDRISPFTSSLYRKDALLMVAFDIPEDLAYKRRQLRYFLKRRDFMQTQRSIWISRYDHRKALKEFIADLKLDEFVEVYACAKLKI